MRHSRVPGPGNHFVQGLQQIGRLVELRSTIVRDARWLLALLREQPDEDLRENCGRKVPMSGLLSGRSSRSDQKSSPGRSDQTLRQPEGRCGGYQEAQVLCPHRLAKNLPQDGKTELRAHDQRTRGRHQFRQLRRGIVEGG